MANCLDQQGDFIQESSDKVELTSVANENPEKAEESNIFRIPVEIRAEICERLDAKSILQLRSTHSLLKGLVDHYIGVNVIISEFPKKNESENDVKNRLRFIGTLALRNICIENLSSICGQSSYGKSEIRAFGKHFNSLFLHPGFLKTIHFDGPIHVFFIRKFLLCCHSLVNFSASANANIIGGLLFSKLVNQNLTQEEATTHLFKINLPKLKFLKLFVMDPFSRAMNINQTENSLSILRTVWSNCLSRLILQIWITQEYTFPSVSWTLISFMKLHPTLATVFICFLYEQSTRKVDSQVIDKIEEGKLTKEFSSLAKTLQLENFGISAKNVHLRIWENFIYLQKRLSHLSLTFSANRISNWEHLYQNTAKTLSQLFVRGELCTPFDCFSLENCTGLEEFCLHNTSENLFDQVCILKNVLYIPCGLKSLILFNTVIATEDILQLLKKLDKLETLVLFKTGKGNGNGVDVHCLEQAFQIRSLMSILIVRFIAIDRKDAKRILQMLDMQDYPNNTGIADITIEDGGITESEEEASSDEGSDIETEPEITSTEESSSEYEFNDLENDEQTEEASDNPGTDVFSWILGEDQVENSNEVVPVPSTTIGLPEEVLSNHRVQSIEEIFSAQVTESAEFESYTEDEEEETLSTENERVISLEEYEINANSDEENVSNYDFHQDVLNYQSEESNLDLILAAERVLDQYSNTELVNEDLPEESVFNSDEESLYDDDDSESDYDEGPEDPDFDYDIEGDNNAAIHVNPEGNELQLVFEGDIDIEEIDVGNFLRVPEIEVHFVLDTILDILASDIRHSHWTRAEDMFGNVIFTLKLCMKSDYY